jgi:lipopolysaccharide export system protein LptA
LQVTRIKLLRRSLIGLIVLVLLAVVVNWVQTWRTRARIIQQTAEILGTEMIRSADSIEYSENDNGVTRFRLRAEKLLETRQGKSLLQGIEAFDFNPDGTVKNQIRSRKAEYDRELRKAVFRENVRIEIGQGVVLRTEVLRYDMPNNLGETDQGLQFESEQAKGKAGTARYDSGRRILDLKGDLDFVMKRPVTRADGTQTTEDVFVTSDEGYYSEADLLLLFRGRAHLDSESAALAGNTIEARFTPDRKRLSSLVCQGSAAYESRDPGDRRNLQGDRIDFKIIDPPGALERIDIFGSARFVSDAASGRQQLKAAEIHVGMDTGKGVPQKIDARTGVEFTLARATGDTAISGNRLEASFVPGTNQMDEMHVWEGAKMSSGGGEGVASDELRAEDIRIGFTDLDGRSVPRELKAQRSVRWISSPVVDKSGKQAQSGRSLSSASLVMRYSKSGETLDSGDAAGGVVLEGLQANQGTRTELRRLQADTVHFVFFPQQNKLREFTGTGDVKVFYRKPPAPSSDAAGDEFQTSSSNIRATFLEADGTADSVAQWGNFVFQDGTRTANAGRGDYDARKDILVLRESPRIADSNAATTGETMEYDQKNRILTVRRRVRSVLGAKSEGPTPFSSSSGSASPSVVSSDAMQYWTEDGRARYTGSVQMLSENGQLQSDSLDIRNGGEQVEAHGNIRHLSVRHDNSGDAQKPKDAPKRGENKGAGRPVLIKSKDLRYVKKENTIHYSGGVVLESDDLRITSDSMDALFDADGKRIEQANARGKLEVRQAGRQVTGEQGEYYLTPGKFVVTGKLAEIQDPVRGKSRARRLTFFTSDDRILLENQ